MDTTSNPSLSIVWKDIWTLSRDFFLSKQTFLSSWLYNKTKAKIATVLFFLLFISQEWLPIPFPISNYYEVTRGIRLALFVYVVIMLVARNDKQWDELISTCQQHIDELEQLDGKDGSKEFYRKQQQDFLVMYNSIFPITFMFALRSQINRWCTSKEKNWSIMEGGLLYRIE